MTKPPTIGVWMIEVLGDGTGERHRRYLVAAHHREAAIAALSHRIGADLIVTSSTKLDGSAAEAVGMARGEVRAI
jgi:hypothetical protein